MITLRSLLEDYLTMRRGLGFKLQTEGTGLLAFVSFMEQQQTDFITNELALKWAQQPTTVQVTQCARRLSFVRGFARYCSAIDARTQVPPTDLIPWNYVRPSPYFFTDDDIKKILDASLKTHSKDKLLCWTYHCLFGLLSVTGMRIGEARGLSLEDVDLDDAILTIRSSKFGKSRIVPLHASTVDVLADYLQRRQRVVPKCSSNLVFVNERGLPLGYEQPLDTFQRLSKMIGLGAQGKRLRPHLHDLRHRFALQTLMHWYRDGEDVARRLPVLSAFLGHTEVRDTYWYLSARPELLELAKERLESYWEQKS